jgi:hypothetical protein
MERQPGKGRMPRRHTAQVSILVAGFLLVYLIAVSPHLVHHAFEKNEGRPACPLLIQSHQTTAEIAHCPSPVTPVVLTGLLAVLPTAEPHQQLLSCQRQPRAPPSPLISA